MLQKLSLYLLILLLVNITQIAVGQSDTIASNDSISTGIKLEHSPKKAAWMSMALPGLGQIYNKKYWKVPIVYAALGTVAYFWVDNNIKYQSYRDAYIYRIDSDSTNNEILYPEYGTEDLRELKNYHWRYRDLNAFIFLGVWALNVLDAVVDAHLYTFDIGEDLTLEVHPNIYSPMGLGKNQSYGVSFCLKF